MFNLFKPGYDTLRHVLADNALILYGARFPYCLLDVQRDILQQIRELKVDATVYLGDMVISSSGISPLRTFMLQVDDAMFGRGRQYYIQGIGEREVGSTFERQLNLKNVAKRVLWAEETLDFGKVILTNPQLKSDLLAPDQRHLSVAERVAKQYKKPVIAASSRWGVSEVDDQIAITSGSIGVKTGVESTIQYWMVDARGTITAMVQKRGILWRV